MPLPRFVQRLFQNDGYGPKLRSEIIPWDDEKRFTALEAWRQAMIGTPMPMAGTTLPPGFMWADGSFASFAAYPELKAKYDAGGFTGMLLAYTASEEDIAAYPGKFKPDAANPSGLFVPRLIGLFARYCGGENAGKHGIDTGRALYGQTVWGDTIGGLGVWGQMSGAFSSTGNKIARPVRSYPVTTEDYDSFLRFDAAALWGDHAGNEFTPEHYRQSVALYLGSPAEV